ncbi:MAG: efflux RND transporter periplasmic adaptor subunit [Bacteroidales bacterium]|nr:efflux RND transporter periplasmic adaptor subunit [Bacteroidales bacterium]
MKKYLLIIPIVLGLLSCVEHHEHHHDHDHGHHHDHDEHCEEEVVSNSVAFSHEQMEKVDFSLLEVKKSTVNQVIKTTAQIVPAQDELKIITASTNGIVEYCDNGLVTGLEVAKNKELFTINNENMAEGNLSVREEEIVTEYKRAKANYERKKSLHEDKLVSESDMQTSETEYLNAKKEYENMKNNFAGGKQLVKSPISGFVNDVLVDNGSYVVAGQTLMTLSKNDKLYLKAEISSKYYTVLKSIVSANIKPLNTNKIYSLNDVNGHLLSYGKSVSANNPLVPVTFEIKNNGELISGSFVELYIIVKSDGNGIMVPNTALVEEMGSFFVFVESKHELFEKRAVNIGFTDGRNTLITNGLNEGETIVEKGAIYVKLAQGSGKLDPHAGHVH